MYYTRTVNLREIGERFGLSEARTSQLHKNALARLADDPRTLELLGRDAPPRPSSRRRQRQARRDGQGGPGQAVEQIDQDGQVVARYESMRQAGQAVALATAYVSVACRKRSKAAGFYWRKAKPRPKPKRPSGRPPRPVAMLDAAGKTARTFPSLTGAARAMECHINAIVRAANLGYTCKGHQWRYIHPSGGL
ncbi:MAG: sigma factor-like helix-turn-helix DNA-binding protein, partial [Phycisphaeraceae bacterium]